METFINTVAILQYNLSFVLTLLLLVWTIQCVNALLGYRLNVFGIYPRHPLGLIGIATAPFLHGSFNHIFYNSIPLFVLISFILLYGKPMFYLVSMLIILLSGLGIWLFGRKALHVGASALIMGYLGFLLMNVYNQGTLMAVGIGIVCLYYFGSLLLSVFPGDLKTSWEGHLFGLLAGILTSYIAPLIYFKLYFTHYL